MDTARSADTAILVNAVTGLVQYDNVNALQPALAESWEVSPDGLTYTFHIREGVYWVTADGQPYAEVTAHDFVAGYGHMLAAGNADTLGTDLIAAYAASDDHTLVITLTDSTPYFPTMLTYACFLPLCAGFYNERQTAELPFGDTADVFSQVYCGPFRVESIGDGQITLVKNAHYFQASAVTLDRLQWVYDDESQHPYVSACNGIYPGIALSESAGTLKKAKQDGNFDRYAYVTDISATTYITALNLNRGTFSLGPGICASRKDERQKQDAAAALQNRNFRKALQHAFDKTTWNGLAVGEDLATLNLRNMYSHPEFTSLEEEVTYQGHTFPAGTFYGELVQTFLDDIGCLVKVADGVDGWYKPEAAQAYLQAAKAELGDSVAWPIRLDVVYPSASTANTAQAQAYKSAIESTLGAENVTVNLIEATTFADYYACGYDAPTGEACNYDVFSGSGWGPDFGDISTYLDSFYPERDGYMLITLGLDL